MNSQAYGIGQQLVAQWIMGDSINAQPLRINLIENEFGGEG